MDSRLCNLNHHISFLAATRLYHHTQPQPKACNTSWTPNRTQAHAARRHRFLAVRYCLVLANSTRMVFDFLQLFNIPVIDLYLPIRSPNLDRPTLVARYAPSEVLETLFTIVLCGCCRLHRCRKILNSGGDSLSKAWNSAPPHQLTTNATNYATFYRPIVYRIWNATRNGIDSVKATRVLLFFVIYGHWSWSCRKYTENDTRSPDLR